MITKTTLIAVRALVFLADSHAGTVLSPRSIAAQLGESPAYMAKVLRSLVKAGILRAERGMRGGVLLARQAREVTLLAIVEACQGAIAGAYCGEIDDLNAVCAFHRAAAELKGAVVKVLSGWNLEQLAAGSRPAKRLPRGMHCLMTTPLLGIARPGHDGGATQPQVRS